MRRVLSFFIRRLGAAMFTLITMITLTFVLFWLIPSEPATFVYPAAQHLSDHQIEPAHHLLGIDRPLTEQYGAYLWHLLRFAFGSQWGGAQLIEPKLNEVPIGP